MAAAIYRISRAQYDPWQRGCFGSNIDEKNARLQLNWPSWFRDDRFGLRHRRRILSNGSLYGRLFIYESRSIRLHHTFLIAHRQRPHFRLRWFISKRPLNYPGAKPMPTLFRGHTSNARLLWQDLSIFRRLGRWSVSISCGGFSYISNFNLLLYFSNKNDGCKGTAGSFRCS